MATQLHKRGPVRKTLNIGVRNSLPVAQMEQIDYTIGTVLAECDDPARYVKATCVDDMMSHS